MAATASSSRSANHLVIGLKIPISKWLADRLEQTDPASAAKLPLLPEKGCDRHNVVGVSSVLETKNEPKSQHHQIGRFAHQRPS